ncbi:MAG: YfiR family protein [Polaromonas sp.]|nr:YfiR family protein [Polaromonas sp.]
MCFCFSPPASSQEFSEYQLKAAFLYNFAAFTEWPPQLGSLLNLCIYGRDPFGVEIDGLNGKATGSRTLAVHRKSSPAALQGCQIVFIAGADIDQLPRLLDTLRGLPVLVVADSPGAARLGAALNMKLAQGRVTFEANLVTARSAGLKLSARMLSLATEVIQ